MDVLFAIEYNFSSSDPASIHFETETHIVNPIRRAKNVLQAATTERLKLYYLCIIRVNTLMAFPASAKCFSVFVHNVIEAATKKKKAIQSGRLLSYIQCNAWAP